MMARYPPPPFSKKGVRKRTPRGNMIVHPPVHGRLCTGARLRRRGAVLREFPATPPVPRAGVTSHLPRLVGEAGWGCSAFCRASAGGSAEAR